MRPGPKKLVSLDLLRFDEDARDFRARRGVEPVKTHAADTNPGWKHPGRWREELCGSRRGRRPRMSQAGLARPRGSGFDAYTSAREEAQAAGEQAEQQIERRGAAFRHVEIVRPHLLGLSRAQSSGSEDP